MPELNYS